MSEEYKYLLCEIKKVAYDSFEIFLKRLGIDFDLFEHLYDIKCIIGKTLNRDSYAEYFEEDNEIIISNKVVDAGLKEVKKGKLTYKKLVEDCAISYLHEMIHANRAIIINNIMSKKNFLEYLYIHEYNINYNEELIKYKYALENVIKNYDITKFGENVPILVSFNKNKSCNVVAYNFSQKEFLIYKNQNIDISLKNTKEFLYCVGIELNTKKHIATKTIKDYFDYEDKITMPCDFYDYNRNVYFNDISNGEIKRFYRELDYKSSLEEILTEALSIIMIYSRNHKDIDFNSIKERIKDENALLGVNFVEVLDFDTIKWFILSSYDDEYYDKFNKIFEEKYNELKKIMYEVYKKRKPLAKFQFDFDDIINEKVFK